MISLRPCELARALRARPRRICASLRYAGNKRSCVSAPSRRKCGRAVDGTRYGRPSAARLRHLAPSIRAVWMDVAHSPLIYTRGPSPRVSSSRRMLARSRGRGELFAVRDCYSSTYLLDVPTRRPPPPYCGHSPREKRTPEAAPSVLLSAARACHVRVRMCAPGKPITSRSRSKKNNYAIPYFYIQQARTRALEACTSTLQRRAVTAIVRRPPLVAGLTDNASWGTRMPRISCGQSLRALSGDFGKVTSQLREAGTHERYSARVPNFRPHRLPASRLSPRLYLIRGCEGTPHTLSGVAESEVHPLYGGTTFVAWAFCF
ncbi:hypothetical protein C8R44DRAFT_198011 [Mycena epipterygia]|nr:hypothetical protein C8R44DRAFT_198011 [Mycena epipterygia]